MGAVRTVNGQSGDVMLAASDVGASPADHTHSAEDVGAVAAVEDSTYKGCYYRMVNGEKEWVNPPLVIDTEYRTAERWNGAAVYTKLIDCGTVTNGKIVQYGVTKTRLLAISVMIGTFPATQRAAGTDSTSSAYYTAYYAVSAQVTLYCGDSAANSQGYAQIWYIK